MMLRNTGEENTWKVCREKFSLIVNLLAKQTEVLPERNGNTVEDTWMCVHETGV
jgi:hypothetical protein